MWSKLSSALRPKQESDSSGGSANGVSLAGYSQQYASTDQLSAPTPDVMSKIKEQHPNMSIFHPSDHHPEEQTIPAPSPPSSPSKNGRFGLFKRTSKAPRSDTPEVGSLRLSNKIRSALHVHTNASATSLPRPSAESLPADSDQEGPMLSPTLPPLLAMPSFGESPLTPLDMPKRSSGGSVRSILREQNTPGTGQSVRFFSRDAYKVITPDVSSSGDSSTNNLHNGVFQRLQSIEPDLPPSTPTSATSPKTPSTDEEESKFFSAAVSFARVFSPPPLPGTPEGSPAFTFPQSHANGTHSTPSLLQPMPPPDMSNIFDLSSDQDFFKPIPKRDASLHDDAIEEQDEDDTKALPPIPADVKEVGGMEGTIRQKAISAPMEGGNYLDCPASPSLEGNKSLGRRAGEAIFRSMTVSSTKSADFKPPLKREATRSTSALGIRKVFGSMDSSKASPLAQVAVSRGRALSETVPDRVARTLKALDAMPSGVLPEADIDDKAAQELIVYAPPPEEADPFSVDGGTYYGPETRIPNSPPRSTISGVHSHGRSDSGSVSHVSHNSTTSLASYDIVHALRNQLELQRELSQQFEIDLNAKDELVEVLQLKVSTYEVDTEKRRAITKLLKRKVAELEKTCRHWEEEVNKSRQEHADRSIMDEASSSALRELHRRIGELEKEKIEVDRKEKALEAENKRLKEDLEARADAERALEDGILDLKSQFDELGAADRSSKSIQISAELDRRSVLMERDRHREMEIMWHEERARMVSHIDEMQAELEETQANCDRLKEEMQTRDEEVNVLKAEIEAQWRHADRLNADLTSLERAVQERDDICDALQKDNAELNGIVEELRKEKETLTTQLESQEVNGLLTAQIDDLEKENLALKEEIASLETRAAEMSLEWTETENKKAEAEGQLEELWAAKDEIEKDKVELDSQLQKTLSQVEDLKQLIDSHQSQVTALKQECQFASDNSKRLEGLVRQRDGEISALAEKIVDREQQLEDLHDEVSKLRREHVRLEENQGREVAEVLEREKDARETLERIVKEKAEIDVIIATQKERLATVDEEMEKLRRQVYELKQESAAKEVRIVQMQKQAEHDEEDRLGLNIALDAKQQELELVKRKFNVKGTAGATPGPPSRTANRRQSAGLTPSNAFTPLPLRLRRESATFTPLPGRPESPASQTSESDGGRRSDVRTPSAPAGKLPAFGRPTKVNGTTAGAAPPSAMRAIEFADESGSMPPPSASAKALLGSSTSSLSQTHRKTASTSTPLSRSVSSRPSLPGSRVSETGGLLKRTSSLVSQKASASNLTDSSDKENTTPKPLKSSTPARAKRMSSIAVSAS